MPTTRTAFEDLPATVRAAIEDRTGPVIEIETASAGFNSQISARVTGKDSVVHLKGLRSDHPRAWTQRREAEVNPYVYAVAPALLWRLEVEGWDLLAFEHLYGHHADYTPGSPDLPKVAATLRDLSAVPCPDIELRHAEQRLHAYVAHPSHAEFFAGPALLHTDLNNENVIVDERALLVDWAWATRGAPWLDAAYWVIWLMAAGGHTPESAEEWAARVPAWHTASQAGITAFAAANANMWEEIAGDEPDEWTARLLHAARDWSAYRSAR